MSYTPTMWQCGDVITAEKMNKIENGIAECCSGGGEPLILTAIDDEEYFMILSETFGTIKTAYMSNVLVLYAELDDDVTTYVPINMLSVDELGGGEIVFVGNMEFEASADSEYPHIHK